jgi:predicted secreted protein
MPAERSRRGAAADARGRRIVAVIECIINQNARDAGAAASVALNASVLRLCETHGVGLVQIPCPEIAVLGCARRRRAGESLRAALDTPDGRARCRAIAGAIGERVAGYAAAGCRILAVLGGNPRSPGCAVHAEDDGLLASSGVLMLELQRELRARRIDVPFRGIRDADAALEAEDLEWLRRLFADDGGC